MEPPAWFALSNEMCQLTVGGLEGLVVGSGVVLDDEYACRDTRSFALTGGARTIKTIRYRSYDGQVFFRLLVDTNHVPARLTRWPQAPIQSLRCTGENRIVQRAKDIFCCFR